MVISRFEQLLDKTTLDDDIRFQIKLLIEEVKNRRLQVYQANQNTSFWREQYELANEYKSPDNV